MEVELRKFRCIQPEWKDSSHTVREAGRPPEQPPEAKPGAQDVPGFAGSRDGLQRSAQRA